MKELQKLTPDSYITEIAEEREELRTIGAGITPSTEKYAEAVNFILSRIRSARPAGFASIIRQFRLEYYGMVKKTLTEKRQVIPCYAGSASCHIGADGDVWGCCVRAESLGNLRTGDFDLAKIWRSPEAQRFRRSVQKRECHCPLANASYTNMLMDPLTMARIAWNLFLPGKAQSH